MRKNLEIFVPPKFDRAPLDLVALAKETGKNWSYSSFGRVSLFHILKSLSVTKILLPVYICSSVLEPLKRLGIEPLYYDLDLRDLNASCISISKMIENNAVEVLLVASMYGNVAELDLIEKLCSEKGVFLIDDAAQSFGASLNGKVVGTFGNAGFFSFSPGKTTAGHMGSFFWSDRKTHIKYTKNCFYHYLKWKDFWTNRMHIYSKNFASKWINYLSRVYSRFYDPYYDNICSFEKMILGGILNDLFSEKFNYRKQYHDMFTKQFVGNDYFRIITSVRGECMPHKIVLVFHQKKILQKFQSYLSKHHIFSMPGYKMLSANLPTLPNAQEVSGKILELPIENDEMKMNYLFEKVADFVRS